MSDDALVSRRIVFTGLGALGVAAALAGCGGTSSAGVATPSQPSSPGSTSAGSADALATTSEIPVGGGLILTDKQIVITQPIAGTFDAFTAVCTHRGFTVTSVANGTISCNHHGSTYSASSGQVTGGPAQSALASVAIKVKGGRIFTA